MDTQKIVVGVDGSEAAYDAVEWAAMEADLRGLGLRVVYAIAPWILESATDPNVEAARGRLRDGGRQVLARALERAAEVAPDLNAESGLVEGGASKALLREGSSARMLVVGGHGVGTAAGLLLGSVSLQVAAHAPCPVAVVPRLEPGVSLEVAVGVDSGESAQAALGFAFEEASRRRARLRAVHAWTRPASSGHGDMQPLVFDDRLVEEEETRVLAEALAGWSAKYPDVEVIEEVVHARPVRALTAASARADLLVVGSRGTGGFAGLLLGSVSHTMLHRTTCPVVIVPR